MRVFMEKNGGEMPPEAAQGQELSTFEKDEQLEACALSGFNVTVRSPVGWRFNRYLESNPDLFNQYWYLGNKDKLEWRRWWSQQEFEQYQKRKTRVEQMVESNSKRGVMLNIDAIIKAEGDATRQRQWQGRTT